MKTDKYEDWSDKEKENGFVCKVWKGTQYDWHKREEVSEIHLEYTPKGWWGNPINVRIREDDVKLSTASGGQLNENWGQADGEDKIRNLIAVLEDALKVIEGGV